jgi:threonine/homoserine/homoserine lactone efflux protein
VDASYFAKGMLLGLSIAAPVGPIGALCIRRTLADGRLAGFVSGLGAATADGFYGAVAAFGLTVITDALVARRDWLQLVGGAFLLWLGLRTLLARPAERAAETRPVSRRGLAGMYASTLALTLANPATILSFIAIFAGLGVASDAAGNDGDAALLVAGVFAGSALWWFILSGGVGLLRARVTTNRLQLVNRVAGGVIVAFGVVALVGVLSA